MSGPDVRLAGEPHRVSHGEGAVIRDAATLTYADALGLHALAALNLAPESTRRRGAYIADGGWQILDHLDQLEHDQYGACQPHRVACRHCLGRGTTHGTGAGADVRWEPCEQCGGHGVRFTR